MKIVITVEGGVVQSVHSDGDVDVQVVDLDDLRETYSRQESYTVAENVVKYLVECAIH